MNNSFTREIIGKEIISLDSVPSTNDIAFDVGSGRKEAEGIVVIADEQTCGRGRPGKKWISPPGCNLYFTVLFEPLSHSGELSFLTIAAAVAIALAVREYTNLAAEIKWPNDIFINGKKGGGILLETRSVRKHRKLLALGIGLNVNMNLNALPLEMLNFTTSLITEKGEYIDKDRLFNLILARLENVYKILLNGNKSIIIDEWIQLDRTLGKTVSVRSGERVITGIAESINDFGALNVRLASGDVETVVAGEVTEI